MTTYDKEKIVETIKVTGNKVFETTKKLIQEGNVRKVTIKNKEGKTIAEFPLTIGIIGAAISPILALLAGILTIAHDCTVIIEKEANKNK